jgi:hypothetical protein
MGLPGIDGMIMVKVTSTRMALLLVKNVCKTIIDNTVAISDVNFAEAMAFVEAHTVEAEEAVIL